jgi:hypothetical protein
MEKFLLLVREDYKVREQMTTEESDKSIHAMIEWIESLAQSGNYLSSEGLDNVGKFVHKDYVLSDGPFIEAKEAISGYMMITAENLEQAASIIQTCPIVLNDGGMIEIRPIKLVSCH